MSLITWVIGTTPADQVATIAVLTQGRGATNSLHNIVAASATGTDTYTPYMGDLDAPEDGFFGFIPRTISGNVETNVLPACFASGAGTVVWTASKLDDTYTLLPDQTELGIGSFRCLIHHANRFWGGGQDGSATKLIYSDVDALTNWDGSQFVEIGGDDGEPIEDVVEYLQGMIIGKENSLWYLTGESDDTFTLRALDGGGAMAGRSLCVTPGGCAAVTRTNVWFYTSKVYDLTKDIAGFGITGDFVTSAYADGKLFIQDSDGPMWVLNHPVRHHGCGRVQLGNHLAFVCGFPENQGLQHGRVVLRQVAGNLVPHR